MTATPAVPSAGLVTPALLAWVVLGTTIDHLPLHRLARQAERSGVALSRSTLAAGVGGNGKYMIPITATACTRACEAADSGEPSQHVSLATSDAS